MNQLARLVDPEALARHDGARARMRVGAPADWAGNEVMVEVAARLCCASCEGGGCDRCGRSGAIRWGDAPRTLCVHLPERLGDGVAVRLFDPFGDASLGELVVEVVVAEHASPTLTRIAPTLSVSAGPTMPARTTWMVVLAAAIAIVVLLWLVTR